MKSKKSNALANELLDDILEVGDSNQGTKKPNQDRTQFSELVKDPVRHLWIWLQIL